MSHNYYQPIENAPKDGSSIILLKIDDNGTINDIDVGQWEVYGGRDDPWAYDPPFSDWTSNRGIEDPTHWMPLPKPSQEPVERELSNERASDA